MLLLHYHSPAIANSHNPEMLSSRLTWETLDILLAVVMMR